VTLETDILRKT